VVKMTKLIRVFDNDGETWDRYTVIIGRASAIVPDIGTADVYGMSADPLSPQGFNQYSGEIGELPAVIDALAGKASVIGKEIELVKAPPRVRAAIAKRLKD
jgi:hypothetical protein